MIKRYWPILLFIFIVFSLFITNYNPGTWLTGWDNLHPEFNFWLNIKRSIFAVWQEYQGLGLLGGMGHSADLPRQILLWIMSIIIPSQLLRYFYHFLMLFIGVLGIYCISKDYILTGYEFKTRIKGSILAAIYYLLNLGTIQYFYVPFEPYSTFWGLFPWEIYVLIRYLNDSSRKNLVLLFLVNLLAVPQGYVQTIFLVYILCVGIFIIFNLLKKHSFHSLIASLKVILVIMTINAFWLLPTLYFMKNNFLVNRNAMQNYMATDKFFQMNKQRGTIGDFIYLKEFYYDFIDYDYIKGDFDYMMTGWRTQFSQNPILVLGMLFFIIICLGLFKKNKYRTELTALFTLSGIIFLSDTYLFSILNDSLRQLAVTDQLFRNPFTKFIVPTIFTFSLLFGLGSGWLLDLFREREKRLISTTLFLLLLISFFYIYFPVWKGDFIYKFERAKIPDDYFQLFNYLNSQTDKGRIAKFPQSDIWGWVYYKWGLTGSGFLWYSTEQPFLDRAFDVWNDKNENYYWEMSSALYSKNLKLFNDIIEKYQVRWFLIDESVFSYTQYKGLGFENLKLMLDSSGKVIERDDFGKLTLYKITLDSPPNKFVFLSNSLVNIGPQYKWNNLDQAYSDYGNYISSNNSLSGRAGLFEESDIDKKNSNKSQTESNSGISIDSPKVKLIHDSNFPSILADNIKHTVPNTRSTVNTSKLDISNKEPKLGAISTAPNQPDARLINREENTFNQGFEIVKPIYAKDTQSATNNQQLTIPDIFYPFRSLFTGRKQEELEFGIKDAGAYFSFKAKIPKSLEGARLVIPKFSKEIIDVGELNLDNTVSKDPQIFLDGEVIDLSSFWGASATPESDSGQARMTGIDINLPYIREGNLEVRVPKVNGLYSYDSNITYDVFENIPKTCDQFNKGLFTQETVVENNTKLLKLTSVGSSNCLDIDLGHLAQRYGYLLTVESKNVKGKSLLISVINKNSQRADLETYLPKISNFKAQSSKPQLKIQNLLNQSFFILPPMEPDAIGYTLHIDNISIGRVKTVNDLGKITVNPIPYRFLTGLKIVTGDLNLQPITYNLQPIVVDHPNPSFYKVDLSSDSTLTSDTYMVLSQSFDKGWHAYEISNIPASPAGRQYPISNILNNIFPFIFGKEIKDHVLINNWENGWDLSSTNYNLQPTSIIIVYLPQYLEYIGFGLLFIFMGFLFLTREKKYFHGIKIEPVVN